MELYHKGSEPTKQLLLAILLEILLKTLQGPSMNILIKLTCLVGLVLVWILGEIYGVQHNQSNKEKQRTNSSKHHPVQQK